MDKQKQQTILHGCSLYRLKELADNSVDSVVTDPPYGLSFMGKKWDYDVPSVDLWREVLRVLKPGGHLLSFGGTRTYHRMAVNIEDAGFEIRDQIQWIYGSGFPKSMDISKAIDKAAGAEREVVGQSPNWRPAKTKGGAGFDKAVGEGTVEINITAPSTPEAKQWQGFGTALKPANEPIVLARKPLSEKTVAANVLKWGVGGLNIDGCRVEGAFESGWSKSGSKESENLAMSGKNYSRDPKPDNPQGRWPANVIFDEAAAAVLDAQSGTLRARGNKTKKDHGGEYNATSYKFGGNESGNASDAGGASRFFYCAKASKSERNAGLEGMPEKIVGAFDGNIDHEHGNRKIGARPDKPTAKAQNHHPTIKPIKLMEYLIKLVTPPGGTVLDPFMGSGSTGVACKKEGFGFVGIERESEYVEIASRRIEFVQMSLFG